MEGVPTPRKKIGNLSGSYPFYDGTVILRFDVDNHVYYRESGSELIPVPGCSSIVKIVDKSGPLMGWQAKKISETILSNMPCDEDELGKYTRSLPIEEFNSLVMGAKNAPKQILEDAGDVGTQAHKCIEDSIKFALRTDGIVTKLVNPPADPRAFNCSNAALNWMSLHNVTWLETERKVYSKEHMYSGTMDGLCVVNSCGNIKCCDYDFENVTAVADWKSSNNLYVEHPWQAAGYWGAFTEEFPDYGVTDIFILRLGKERGEFEPWHMSSMEVAEDFKSFKTCLELTRANERIVARIKQKKANKKNKE